MDDSDSPMALGEEAPAPGASSPSAIPVPALPRFFPTPFKHYDYGIGEPPKTLHEMKLMNFEGAVCDKPDWAAKLGDEAIVGKWRAEAPSLSDNEFEFCMAELRWRAERWPGPSRPAAVEGVFAADGLLPAAQLAALKGAVSQLEATQRDADAIDWHPGSNQQVRDLVHPSLFCYRRGITPELPDASVGAPTAALRTRGEGPSSRDTVGQLTRSIGSGSPRIQAPPAPDPAAAYPMKSAAHPMKSADGLVWLPSEFRVGADGHVSIESYINQMDPKQCPSLYGAVGEAFERLVPLLEDVLTVSACSDERNWEAEREAARKRMQRESLKDQLERVQKMQEEKRAVAAAGEGPAAEQAAATVEQLTANVERLTEAVARLEEEQEQDGDDDDEVVHVNVVAPDLHTAGRVSVGGNRAVIKIDGMDDGDLPLWLTRQSAGAAPAPWLDPSIHLLYPSVYSLHERKERRMRKSYIHLFLLCIPDGKRWFVKTGSGQAQGKARRTRHVCLCVCIALSIY